MIRMTNIFYFIIPQSVIDANIFPILINIMDSNPQFKTRKEAAWAILNATSGGTSQQIRYIHVLACTDWTNRLLCSVGLSVTNDLGILLVSPTYT